MQNQTTEFLVNTQHPRPFLDGAHRFSAWNLQVYEKPSGVLELYATADGYIWRWTSKPLNLVALTGVLDDTPASTQRPARFAGVDDAIDYIMYGSGVAYAGACGLEAIH